MSLDEKIKALDTNHKRVFIALVLNNGLTKEQAYEKVISMDIYADLPLK